MDIFGFYNVALETAEKINFLSQNINAICYELFPDCDVKFVIASNNPKKQCECQPVTFISEYRVEGELSTVSCAFVFIPSDMKKHFGELEGVNLFLRLWQIAFHGNKTFYPI